MVNRLRGKNSALLLPHRVPRLKQSPPHVKGATDTHKYYIYLAIFGPFSTCTLRLKKNKKIIF